MKPYLLCSKIIPSFFTIKKAFFYLSVSPARRAPLSPQAPLSMVFTPPSVPPLGGQKPQEREDVADSSIAPPGFWSASGACARKGLAGSAYAIKLRLFDATELRVFVGWRIA